MIVTSKRAANAAGGKTARACDGCLHKRVRWYCAADDAFLCQGCDSSVHSANQLASRHERVLLEPKSSHLNNNKNNNNNSNIRSSTPSWHRGLTRKARTPRHARPVLRVVHPSKEEAEEKIAIVNTLPLVPEIGSEEASQEEEEEQLLYRVPIYDPFAAQLCCNVSNESEESRRMVGAHDLESRQQEESSSATRGGGEFDVFLAENGDLDVNLQGLILPSDMDLAEFAADVESLLGTGLDEDSCGIQGLGLELLDCKEEEEEEGIDAYSEGRKVKVEDEDYQIGDAEEAVGAGLLDMDWNFDYESPVTGENEDEENKVVNETESHRGCKEEVGRKIFLRLNHEAVITAWASQGCPWTTGIRPQHNPDGSWPDFMGLCPTGYYQLGGGGVNGGHVRCGDGVREARVSRYREKRRTRLFSKKIRYEVRKQNAEKRPRMKGRFVKRAAASFAGPPPPARPNYLMKKHNG